MADTRACTLSAGPASLTLARGASTLTCRHTGLRLQKDAGPASSAGSKRPLAAVSDRHCGAAGAGARAGRGATRAAVSPLAKPSMHGALELGYGLSFCLA